MTIERDKLSKAVEDFSPQSDENNPEIIKAFLEFLGAEQDYSEWSFDGENAYGDRQVTYAQRPWGFCMEIVYSSTSIKAYNGASDYWQPEYIQLSGERAKPLLEALKACLTGVFFGGES